MKSKRKYDSLVFMVLGILSLLTLLYTHNSWIDLVNNNKAQIDNISRAQVNITHAHLWFEESISGDSSINIKRDVWRNIDNTESLLKQLLNGGINAQGLTLTAISNAESRESIEQIRLHLTKFKRIAQQRLDSQNNGQPGSTLDQHFDDTYNEIIISIRSINNKQLQNFNTGIDNQKIQYYLVSLIWLIIILLFIFKLAQSTKKAKSITEEITQFIYTANAPIFGIDTQGKVNQWNQKSAEITGYHVDEVLGKNLVEEFIRADYRESVNDVLQKALKGEETSHFEFPLYTKDNNFVMVLLNATTRRNAKGDIMGVVGVGQDITELDSFRAEIGRVLAYNKAIIVASLDALITIDSEGNVTDFNKVAEDTFGWSYEEIVGKLLEEHIIPQNMREAHRRGMKHYLATGNGTVMRKQLELVGLHKDGHTFPIEMVMLSAEIDGKPMFTAAIKDISERRANEERLLKAQQDAERVAKELTQFIYTANAPIFGIDTQGKINQWNKKSAEITGYQADEVRGKDLVEEFITADYRESLNDVLQKALKGDETSNFEFPFYTKDNNLVMVLLNATTRRNLNGDVVGVVGVVQDITELDSYRTKMETKVKERTRELDTILSLSPDGFLFSNADKNIVYINPALLAMTGFKAELFIGKSTQFFSELLEGLFDPNHLNDKVFVGNKDGEHIIYLSNPVLRIINCNQRTMVGLKGEIEGQVLYFRDVTHDTEVENMKSEFLSTAAHELRTPLASICGFSELLINRDYDKKMSHEMIEIIHRQSLNLKHLLDELLDLSRIEARAGKDFFMMKNSLKEVVNKSCVEVEGAFQGRKVEIQSLEDWPIMSFDSDKIHQVFNNLLSNAFKYSPEDKSVLLKTSEREKDGNKQFGVSIIDNGIGMTPQQLARLGERFYRADDSGSIPGTGLGVSLVKEIVSIHAGDIEFTSDKGMVVTVWLPMDKNKYTEE